MSYVLVTILGGLIDRVTFYDQAPGAIRALYRCVKTMNPDENDAAVCGPDELIANAKIFLDERENTSKTRMRKEFGLKMTRTVEIYFRDLTPEAQDHLLKEFRTSEEDENWDTTPIAVIGREVEDPYP